MEKEVILKPTLIRDLGLHFMTEKSKRKHRIGLYKCNFCNTEFEAHTQSINQGKTKSCGCYNISKRFKHGLVGTRIYSIWIDIKSRVFNSKNKSYKDYGGRGVTICEEWLDVQNFYNWAMSNGYSEELSIDRIDNDGNYCPENCRWTTQNIQARNRRVGKPNKSGYKGVYIHPLTLKFRSQISINKKRINLGTFPTAVEGAIAYNNYIIENNLEGFILNEIPEEYQQKISTIKFKGKSSL